MKNFTHNDYSGLHVLSPLLEHELLTMEDEQNVGRLLQQDLGHMQRIYSAYPFVLSAFCDWARKQKNKAFHREAKISEAQMSSIDHLLTRAAGTTDLDVQRRLNLSAQDIFQDMLLTHDATVAIHRGVAQALEKGLAKQIPMLKRDHPLAERRLQDWENTAKTVLEHNYRLVFDLAARYCGNGIDLEELFQEGVIGLKRGVEKWNVHLGLRFSTYAHPWVKQAVQRSIDNKADTIRVPVHLHQKRRQGIEINAPTIQSIHTPIGSDDSTVQDLIIDETVQGPGDSFESEDFAHVIEQALSQLDDTSRRLVQHSFGLGTEEGTKTAMANKLGISTKEMGALHANAMLQLSTTLSEMGVTADILTN